MIRDDNVNYEKLETWDDSVAEDHAKTKSEYLLAQPVKEPAATRYQRLTGRSTNIIGA